MKRFYLFIKFQKRKKGMIVVFYATFFAFDTAKSIVNPAIRPIKTSPNMSIPAKDIVCAIAIPANPETMTAPRNFLMSYLGSFEPRNPLTVFSIAPEQVARTTASNGSTM